MELELEKELEAIEKAKAEMESKNAALADLLDSEARFDTNCCWTMFRSK